MSSLQEEFKQIEASCEGILPLGTPFIVRVDGHAFSKLKGFKKPFDPRFDAAMDAAAKELLSYFSGSLFAYIQSDEISLLVPNEGPDTFLNNRKQKIASLCAAKASGAFNLHRMRIPDSFMAKSLEMHSFDARVFSVSKDWVQRYFLWRQLDSQRNAISSSAYWSLRKQFGRKTAHNMLKGLKKTDREKHAETLDEERLLGRIAIRVTRDRLLSECMPPDIFQDRLEKGFITEDQTVTRNVIEIQTAPRFNYEYPPV